MTNKRQQMKHVNNVKLTHKRQQIKDNNKPKIHHHLKTKTCKNENKEKWLSPVGHW